jgi:hypothetical protein
MRVEKLRADLQRLLATSVLSSLKYNLNLRKERMTNGK